MFCGTGTSDSFGAILDNIKLANYNSDGTLGADLINNGGFEQHNDRSGTNRVNDQYYKIACFPTPWQTYYVDV